MNSLRDSTKTKKRKKENYWSHYVLISFCQVTREGASASAWDWAQGFYVPTAWEYEKLKKNLRSSSIHFLAILIIIQRSPPPLKSATKVTLTSHQWQSSKWSRSKVSESESLTWTLKSTFAEGSSHERCLKVCSFVQLSVTFRVPLNNSRIQSKTDEQLLWD